MRMNKRTRYIALWIFLLLPVTAGVAALNLPDSSTDGNAPVLGAGGVTAAVQQNAHMQSMNPAALYFSSGTRFLLDFEYLDTYDPDADLFTGIDAFITQPLISYELNYLGNGWSIGVYSDYAVTNRGVSGNELSIDISKDNVAEFDFAFGVGAFSVGADIRALKSSSVGNRKIGMGGTMLDIGLELLQDVFLDEISSGVEEKLEMGAGFMAQFGNITVGFYSDKVIDYTSGSGSSLAFDVSSIMKNGDFGLAYSSAPYAGIGSLNLASFFVSAELKNIADEQNRSLHFGMSGSLLLTEKISFALAAGYYRMVPDVSEILSLGGDHDGYVTAGVSANLLFMSISGALILPEAAAASLLGSSAAGSDRHAAGKISFGFFL